MAAKKEKFEEWKKGKDYIMWTRLKEMCDNLDLTSSSFISYVDLGGFYWEPLLELIYKYGNILKKTYKLKEIKMEYIRPLNYLGAQSDIEVVFDNDKYFVPKLASGKASQARFSFSHLIDSIRNIDNLNETNYTKECKTFKSDFNNFLKNLSSFVYEKDENGITGYRYLTENIKLILYPLRMLRKSAYRLFSVEKLEQKYQDLMTFTDKNDIKLYVEGVHQFLESEVYKQNRNCDVNELDKYMERALNDESYKYKFNDKIHVEEKKVDKDDKGNPKEDKKAMPKTLSLEEIEKIKNEEERKKLTLINIKKIEQEIPNIFIKKALQKDFEIGLDLMYKFLSKKIGKDYPFPIDTHKIFVNIYQIPKGREILQIDYYLGQLFKFIEELKLMSYEMKLNGLVRTLIPIQANTEYIAVLKKIYDMHNIIDRILGDKLLYDQYLFIYDMIKFIHDSPMKEDLELYKNKKFMEQSVPKYIFYMSLIKSADIFIKFQKNSRKDGGHFTLDQYYQPLKHEIDGSNNIALNAYEVNAQIKKGVSENYLENEKLFWEEVNNYGRFWLMEGYFPPEDRDKWLIAIEELSNINKLVQEDIRDMILTGNDERYRNFSPNPIPTPKQNEKQKESNQNTSFHKKVTSSKKINKESDNTLSDSSRNHGHGLGKRREKNDSHHLTKKRSISRKNTNQSKKSTSREKDKKESHRSDSMDSTDRIIVSLPKNKNGLRPPFVWNFPIERIEEIRTKLQKEKEKIEEVHRNKNKRITKKQNKPQLEIVFKEEQKKNEVRKVNAYPYYHDGRIEKFIDLFNELFMNCMKYSKSKGNTWEYVYSKILQVFGVEYIFAHPKEEEPEPVVPVDANSKEEKKEGENKKEEEKKENKKEGEENEKKEESKEGDGEEKKEENKEEGEKKEGDENKPEEKKEGENKVEENKEEVKEEEKKEEENKGEENNDNKKEEIIKQNTNEEEKNAN